MGLSAAARHRLLTTALRWLAAVLVLRVLAPILANYPDYLPPDFGSLFLQGRDLLTLDLAWPGIGTGAGGGDRSPNG